MPAKIRSIKADLLQLQVHPFLEGGFIFEFNKSINYKGEKSGALILKEKKPGVFKVKVFQDLNGDGEMTKPDLIFKGKIKNVEDADDLTNFIGSIKLKKQMHKCEWDLQKLSKNKESDISDFICTADYIPTMYGFVMKSATTGEKYFFDGIGDFMPEGIIYADEPKLSSFWYGPANWARWTV